MKLKVSKGKGKINCVVNIPSWKSKIDALEALQKELQVKWPDAKLNLRDFNTKKEIIRVKFL